MNAIDGGGGSGRRFPIIRALFFGTLGLVLVWSVISYSYVAYLADSDPARALAVRRDSKASLNFVEAELTRKRAQQQPRSLSPDDKPEVADASVARLRALAEMGAKTREAGEESGKPDTGHLTKEEETLRQHLYAAMRADPLSARGLRLLALLNEPHVQKEEVANLMRMAVARNLREARALYWLMVSSANARAFSDAISYADVVLRTQSLLSGAAFQVLARATETPEGFAEVRRRVLANPPWRKGFFTAFSASVSDGRIPLQLLLDLKGTSFPPAPEEIAGYMQVLLQNKLYELAYYAWLQFLPPGQLAMVTHPFNGSFELKPSGMPFDWSIPKGAGVTAELVAKPGNASEKALLVEFGIGRLDFAGVQQLILLAPGSYRFSARYLGEVSGRRGLVWVISCVEGEELGRSQMMLGSVSNWSAVDFQFSVPANCRAQRVRLLHDARSASEQLVTGKSFHDEVRIERLDAQ